MTHPLAAAALRLRGWALGVLAGGAAASTPPPDVPDAAWVLFLRGERCALPLRGALSAAGGAAALPEGPRALLQRTADRELLGALAGQAQLRRLGAQLVERGWTGIALKGGALLATGEPRLQVADVDLLLPRAQAFEFVRLLEVRGLHAADPDPWERSTQAFHLALRAGGHEMPVEVHFRIPFAGEVDPWREPRPSPTPGIALLRPPLQLWHVLVHAVDHHLERRGRIRDLLLLRAALDDCTAEEVAEVERRAGEHRSAAAQFAMLGMARALGGGEVPVDGFRATAALRYLLVADDGPFRVGTPRALETISAAAALVSGHYLRRWAGDESSPLTSPSARGSSWLDRHLPLLALPGRAVWRGTRLARVTLPALRLARAARRLAADAG